jgi:hypothetical protein
MSANTGVRDRNASLSMSNPDDSNAIDIQQAAVTTSVLNAGQMPSQLDLIDDALINQLKLFLKNGAIAVGESAVDDLRRVWLAMNAAKDALAKRVSAYNVVNAPCESAKTAKINAHAALASATENLRSEEALVSLCLTDFLAAAENLTAARKGGAEPKEIEKAEQSKRSAVHDWTMAKESMTTARAHLEKAEAVAASADLAWANSVKKVAPKLKRLENELEAAKEVATKAAMLLRRALTTAQGDAQKSNFHNESLIHSFEFVKGVQKPALGVVREEDLDPNSTKSCNVVARLCADGVRDCLRCVPLAVTWRDTLAHALRELDVDESSLLTENVLRQLFRNVLCHLSERVQCAIGDNDVNHFVLGALLEMMHRLGMDARSTATMLANEALMRYRNARLLTNAIEDVAPEVDREQTADLETHSKKTIGDATVYVCETCLRTQGSEKIATDLRRLDHFALVGGLSNGGATRYCFTVAACDDEIDVRVAVVLFWRVVLNVRVVRHKFGSKLTFREFFDYLRDVVAITQVTRSPVWRALGFLGLDGVGGKAPDDNVDDDVDDEQRHYSRSLGGAEYRVRLQKGDRVAPAPDGPAPMTSPSQPGKQASIMLDMLNGELVSRKEFDDGSGVYVFVGAERALKVFAARAGSRLAAEAANEVAIHKQLMFHVPWAVVPLLDVLDVLIDDDVCARHRLCCGSAARCTVVVTARANGAQLDWSALEGNELAVSGEQLLTTTSALAGCGVVHSDVKPSNTVVHNGTVRLLDFGLSAQIDFFTRQSALVSAGGTRGFMAPEICEARELGRKTTLSPAVDVFSTGCVLSLAKRAMGECHPLRRLVERMTAANALLRPSAEDALKEWRRDVAPALKNSVEE